MENKLTQRQWKLYHLIYENSFVEHRKTTQKEICDTLADYEWNSDEKAHDHCTMVWADIKAINESMEHDKLIISKNFEYWVGSKEETEEFLKGLWKALAPRLKRYWLYSKKVGMDGLGKLIDENGNITDKFFECFNDYESED